MPLAIVITKDKDTALALEGRGFELKNTSSKGTYFYAKEDDGKTVQLLEGLPKAAKVSSDELQTIFAKNTGWGGEDYTIPQSLE